MKHKVGNRVKVKSLDWYNSNKNEDGNVPLNDQSFTKDMLKFCGRIVTIKKVIKNRYIIEEDDFGWYFTDEMFEEGIRLNESYYDETNILKIDTNLLENQKIIWTETSPDITELVIGKNYELIIDDGVCKVIKKKPKYPKTYVECAKILDCFSAAYIDGYKNELIEKLQELLVCRDAYWKIVGEQMGLGKSWEPDWDDGCQYKYGLFRLRNIICKDKTAIDPNLLVFPSIEMRDAFYENFKDLIEECKELL